MQGRGGGNNFPLKVTRPLRLEPPRAPARPVPVRRSAARPSPSGRQGRQLGGASHRSASITHRRLLHMARRMQGGIRVNGFASGGAIPPPMRGAKLPGLFAVWDWRAPPRIAASLYHATASSRAPPALTRYATLVAGVAGLDATDTEARPEPRAPLLCSNRSLGGARHGRPCSSAGGGGRAPADRLCGSVGVPHRRDEGALRKPDCHATRSLRIQPTRVGRRRRRAPPSRSARRPTRTTSGARGATGSRCTG
jgi:hypothetical protein